ncbi:hypothetical protein KL86CLO1_11671 [uncultured Eubacteriales bacterium]|uniref:Uncharacterized protein n=1 Tax=uncultured Eubacteriales bacterium TaxID=172733 RepID=A0A212JT26_9FIRM|nr:hypothetical protein KL86CLO1_11671 [uncultured Eubacteriales bacterium]
MEENITSGMQEDFGVKLLRRQNKDRTSLERSTSAMSDDIEGQILEIISHLNPEYLGLALIFARQAMTHSILGSAIESQAVTGEQYP